MSDVIQTKPPSYRDKNLKEKFAEVETSQCTLLDELAKQLITIELAIPGLYAAMLKLVSGSESLAKVTWVVWIAFGAWFIALVLTLAALFPRKWEVNPNAIEQKPDPATGVMGIADFFKLSAVYKRGMLLAASLIFFSGIVAAVISIFQ